jgi:hypothetical protein
MEDSMKLPKEIYVRRENQGTDDECLLAEQNLIQLAELGETHEVGVYRLERVLKVSGVTEIVEKK